MKSLYESILSSTSSGKESFHLTEKYLVEKGYKVTKGPSMEMWYQSNKNGEILSWRYLYKLKDTKDFLFKFDLYRKSYTVIVKTINDLSRVEMYWEELDRREGLSEVIELAKIMKNSFELKK